MSAPTAAAGRAGRERGTAQQQYVQLYKSLMSQVKESGLLRRRYAYYWTKMSVTVAVLAGIGVGVFLSGDSWFQLILAGGLAFVFAQLAFIGHDAAHRQIFKSWRGNEWASLINGTLLGGLSLGWWQNKHSRHHANPNKHGEDPDIAPGAIAFTPYARGQRRGLGAYLADRQGWFFFPLLLLEGVNLHVRSVQRLFSRGKPTRHRVWESVFLTVRLGGYVTALLLLMSPARAAAFLGVQLGLYGLYLGTAFAVNHIGMPTVPADLKLDFLRRQVLMSRNITGRRVVHFLLGGLNYQIEHHLFPSMPRPNLHRVQPLVQRVCRDHDISYAETNLPTALKTVTRYLNNVGLAGRDPFGCPLASQLRAPA